MENNNMAQLPKDKALYLINKMLRASPNVQDGVNKIDFIQAKICAEFAVDEILDSRPSITDSQIEYQNYWQQVKEEINNL